MEGVEGSAVSCEMSVHPARMVALAEYLSMWATLRIKLENGVTGRLSLLFRVASLRRDTMLGMDARNCYCQAASFLAWSQQHRYICVCTVHKEEHVCPSVGKRLPLKKKGKE